MNEPLRASAVGDVIAGRAWRAVRLMRAVDIHERAEILAQHLPHVVAPRLALAMRVGQLLEPLHMELCAANGLPCEPAPQMQWAPEGVPLLVGRPDAFVHTPFGTALLEAKTIGRTTDVNESIARWIPQLAAYRVLCAEDPAGARVCDQIFVSVLRRDVTTSRNGRIWQLFDVRFDASLCDAVRRAAAWWRYADLDAVASGEAESPVFHEEAANGPIPFDAEEIAVEERIGVELPIGIGTVLDAEAD